MSDYDEPVFNHVGQATVDINRAIAFYELLGFTLERRMTLPDEAAGPLLAIDAPGLEAAYLTLGSFTLELMQFHRDGNPPWRERVFNDPGLTHLSISVVDLDATVEAVVAHGGEVVTRLPVAVMVRDPDGQLLELLTMDYPRHIDAGRARQPG